MLSRLSSLAFFHVSSKYVALITLPVPRTSSTYPSRSFYMLVRARVRLHVGDHDVICESCSDTFAGPNVFTVSVGSTVLVNGVSVGSKTETMSKAAASAYCDLMVDQSNALSDA